MKYIENELDQQRTEAVIQRCSVEKIFLEISQNSQEKPVLGSLF